MDLRNYIDIEKTIYSRETPKQNINLKPKEVREKLQEELNVVITQDDNNEFIKTNYVCFEITADHKPIKKTVEKFKEKYNVDARIVTRRRAEFIIEKSKLKNFKQDLEEKYVKSGELKHEFDPIGAIKPLKPEISIEENNFNGNRKVKCRIKLRTKDFGVYSKILGFLDEQDTGDGKGQFDTEISQEKFKHIKNCSLIASIAPLESPYPEPPINRDFQDIQNNWISPLILDEGGNLKINCLEGSFEGSIHSINTTNIVKYGISSQFDIQFFRKVRVFYCDILDPEKNTVVSPQLIYCIINFFIDEYNINLVNISLSFGDREENYAYERILDRLLKENSSLIILLSVGNLEKDNRPTSEEPLSFLDIKEYPLLCPTRGFLPLTIGGISKKEEKLEGPSPITKKQESFKLRKERKIEKGPKHSKITEELILYPRHRMCENKIKPEFITYHQSMMKNNTYITSYNTASFCRMLSLFRNYYKNYNRNQTISLLIAATHKIEKSQKIQKSLSNKYLGNGFGFVNFTSLIYNQNNRVFLIGKGVIKNGFTTIIPLNITKSFIEKNKLINIIIGISREPILPESYENTHETPDSLEVKLFNLTQEEIDYYFNSKGDSLCEMVNLLSGEGTKFMSRRPYMKFSKKFNSSESKSGKPIDCKTQKTLLDMFKEKDDSKINSIVNLKEDNNSSIKKLILCFEYSSKSDNFEMPFAFSIRLDFADPDKILIGDWKNGFDKEDIIIHDGNK